MLTWRMGVNKVTSKARGIVGLCRNGCSTFSGLREVLLQVTETADLIKNTSASGACVPDFVRDHVAACTR